MTRLKKKLISLLDELIIVLDESSKIWEDETPAFSKKPIPEGTAERRKENRLRELALLDEIDRVNKQLSKNYVPPVPSVVVEGDTITL